MRTQRACRLASVVACRSARVGSVAGHQGWSGYDQSHRLPLTGIIQEAGYEHPHGSLRLAVPDQGWRMVLAPPSRLESRGLLQVALKISSGVLVYSSIPLIRTLQNFSLMVHAVSCGRAKGKWRIRLFGFSNQALACCTCRSHRSRHTTALTK